MNVSTHDRRRWLRISLWSLSILALGTAAFFAGPAIRMRWTGQMGGPERSRLQQPDGTRTEADELGGKPESADAIALRDMPYVHQVATRLNNPDASCRIIHIKDWHFVGFEEFAADVHSQQDEPVDGDGTIELYKQHLDAVEAVQKEQVALLSAILDKLDVSAVFVEGLTERDMPVFKAISRMIAEKEKTGELVGLWETMLRHGAVGRLYRQGVLKDVLPLEDEAAYAAANPVGENGTVEFDAARNEKREDAQARNLLARQGVVVVILGGAHDLTDNLRRLAGDDVQYVQVETKAYSRAVGQQ